MKLKIRNSKLLALLLSFALLYAGSAAPATGDTELRRHTVTVDGHPIALWEKSAANANEAVLLVHGRTWSALPDFDLQVDGEELSLMGGLVKRGYAVYAIDLRGYGETPRDATGWLTPDRAADDIAATLQWIAAAGEWRSRPHLFGWSMGSTLSQLAVQRHPGQAASLTLFGYWRDVDVRLPADPPDLELARIANTAEAAASDFITPGSISAKAIAGYVETALLADPVKVDIRSQNQYNALDGSKILLPTLVIYGALDPIAPSIFQEKLFRSIGSAHKQLVSVQGGDHAAFLEAPRDYFIHELVNFFAGASM
jgi:alpha-beta hydrolase superfamily lysophospholipase